MYTDNRYRSKANSKTPFSSLTTINLYSPEFPSNAEASISTAVALNAGTSLCKDMVNSPPNILNPLSMSDLARSLAKDSGGLLKCEVLGSKECEKRGMGAYLGVARGSETEPQFIHLTYTPPSTKPKRKLAIVGKGLTFDAGGYNIKTSMMELMKFDMGGSGATLGSALAISKLAPPNTEVHFLVAACETMINERAMRPGDVLTASNGKTIEVLNTDAEGRLTLADALVYADKELGAEKVRGKEWGWGRIAAQPCSNPGGYI
jgi:leucyl aminopeptidase